MLEYSVLKKVSEETGDATPGPAGFPRPAPSNSNQAVLEALGWDTSRRDEFFLLNELSSLWRQPVPVKTR